jgi:RimJ/RimL family protein N-acetyltransferase
MPPTITLRDVIDSDLEIFFENEQDPTANHMAAFTRKDPSDRAAFDAHRAKINADPTVLNKTIMVDGQVVGSVAKFEMYGDTEVTYWISKDYWGKGIVTQALAQFLNIVTVRPIFGRAAKDNLGSIRVLEKCGFKITGHDKGFANARGEEIEEVVMTLE